MEAPLFTNDAVVLGILVVLLAVVFKTAASEQAGWKKFYSFIPMLLLCYFLPAILTTLGLIAPEWYDHAELVEALKAAGLSAASEGQSVKELLAMAKDANIAPSAYEEAFHESKLYFIASRFFLPASLILLTLSVNLREIFKLGPKALIMFFSGTVGVIIGGPIAIWLTAFVAPEVVGGQGPDEIWRGMATVAGSWIGGGANQAAMYEMYEPSGPLYSIAITVDVIVAEVWMFFLLLGVGRSKQIDKYFNADASSVTTLQEKMHEFSQKIARIATSADLMVIIGIALGLTGLSHLMADHLAPFVENNLPFLKQFSLHKHFFWLIVLATTFGVALSFTRARNYEGAGASKVGTVFIYFLVATIGMKMDVMKIFSSPGLFAVGLIWMLIHVGILFVVAKLIRAPFFFLAVGSKANIGGAASAPVVAAAFHPSLAPVGVLLAVVGYAVGTYGAIICAILMRGVSP